MCECPHCRAKALIWQNDFSYEDYCREGDGIVSVWSCGKCNATIECYIDLDQEEEQ